MRYIQESSHNVSRFNNLMALRLLQRWTKWCDTTRPGARLKKVPCGRSHNNLHSVSWDLVPGAFVAPFKETTMGGRSRPISLRSHQPLGCTHTKTIQLISRRLSTATLGEQTCNYSRKLLITSCPRWSCPSVPERPTWLWALIKVKERRAPTARARAAPADSPGLYFQWRLRFVFLLSSTRPWNRVTSCPHKYKSPCGGT